MSDEITVNLDRPRAIRWTFGAQARLGSLQNPPELRDLTKPRRAFFAICAFVWASLDRGHPFETPDALAEFIGEESKTKAAVDAFMKEFKRASSPDGNVPKNG